MSSSEQAKKVSVEFTPTLHDTILNRLKYLSSNAPLESEKLDSIPDDDKSIYMYPGTYECVSLLIHDGSICGYCVSMPNDNIIRSTIIEHYSRILVIDTGYSRSIINTVLSTIQMLLTTKSDIKKIPLILGLSSDIMESYLCFYDYYIETIASMGVIQQPGKSLKPYKKVITVDE